MSPYTIKNLRALISKITIKELSEVYTVWDNVKYYNYIEISPGASEVTGTIRNETNYTIIFIGNAPSYTKEILQDEININDLSNNSKSFENVTKIKTCCYCKPRYTEIKISNIKLNGI
jgi:hypothetical protein